MTIIPIRNSNAYVGFGKQTVQGTAVAPTLFPRWLDGSNIDVVTKMETIREGDGTRRNALMIKNLQNAKVKLVCYPRPIEVGFLETASLGASSDTITVAAMSTTVAASHAVGDTTLIVSSATGLPTTPCSLVYDPGTVNEEIVNVLSAVTTTLTVSPLKLAHAVSRPIASVSTHTMIDKTDGNYYTIEVGLGSLFGGAGSTLRFVDCKVNTVKRHSKAGMLLTMETDWEGVATVVQAAASTVTLEAHAPYFYSTGSWTLDGVTTGDAPFVENFDIAQKNNLDTSIQTEKITLDAVIFGNVDITLSYTAVFQNPAHMYLTWFGSGALPGTGATDAQSVGVGALILTFTQVDGFHTLQYTCTTLNYTKATAPVPKVDGKHMMLGMVAESTSNSGANLFVLQAVVGNTQNTAY